MCLDPVGQQGSFLGKLLSPVSCLHVGSPCSSVWVPFSVLWDWISEITSVKQAGKEKVGLSPLSSHTRAHMHVHTITNPVSFLGLLSCQWDTELVCLQASTCASYSGQLLPSAQLIFCFMNPLLLWGFFLLLFELKWIRNLVGQGHQPGWQRMHFLLLTLSLPSTITLHSAQKIKHSNKIWQPRWTAPSPSNRGSPRFGLVQGKESPGKELFSFDLHAGWPTGGTAEWRERTMEAANWIIKALNYRKGSRSPFLALGIWDGCICLLFDFARHSCYVSAIAKSASSFASSFGVSPFLL